MPAIKAIRIEPETYEKVREIAKLEHRTISMQFKLLVEKALADEPREIAAKS